MSDVTVTETHLFYRDPGGEMSDREQLRGLCLGAIETMRSFLADAERQIRENRPETDFSGPQDWPGIVVHALGWGAANASSSLERAIRRLRLPIEKETQEEER